MLEPRRLAGLGLVIATVVAGCTGASHGSAPARGPSSATKAPTVAPTPTIQNPFTIIARYTAASLGLKQPLSLAVGPNGNLYFTDLGSQTVAVISPAGKIVRKWGKPGSRPGEFNFHLDVAGNPHASIAVGPDGKVYVSDSGNSRVQVFSPSGAFIRQFGRYGLDDGQFVEVYDLTVDRNGNTYVADDQKTILSKFSPTGRFQWSVGGPATTDPDLRGSVHLATVDSHGRVVIALDDGSPGPGRIVYLDGKGHKVDAFGMKGDFPDGSCDVTVDAVGYTFVDSCFGETRNTQVFDRTHRLVGAWYGGPFALSPRFGPNGEVFALGVDGTVLRLKVLLPGA